MKNVIEDLFDAQSGEESIKKFCQKLTDSGDEYAKCTARLYEENFKKTYDWYRNELDKYNNQNISAIVSALQTVNTTICLNIIHSNVYDNDEESKKKLVEALIIQQKSLIDKFENIYKLMNAVPSTMTKQ